MTRPRPWTRAAAFIPHRPTALPARVREAAELALAAPVSPDLRRGLRSAIRTDALERLLFAAGAPDVVGSAPEVLREAGASMAAEALVRAGRRGHPDPPEPPEPPFDRSLVRYAQDALDEELLAAVVEPDSPAGQAALQTVAEALTSISYEAAVFARSEGRALCHNCVAMGAMRAAARQAVRDGSQVFDQGFK